MFPQVNNFHNLKHIVHDLKKPGIKDEEIVAIAKKQNRIIITKNTKHFRDCCQKKKVDLIGVTEIAILEKFDKEIMAYLRRKKQRKMTGTFKKVTFKKTN